MKQRLKNKLAKLNRGKKADTWMDENGNTFKEGDPCDCGDPDCKIVIKKMSLAELEAYREKQEKE